MLIKAQSSQLSRLQVFDQILHVFLIQEHLRTYAQYYHKSNSLSYQITILISTSHIIHHRKLPKDSKTGKINRKATEQNTKSPTLGQRNVLIVWKENRPNKKKNDKPKGKTPPWNHEDGGGRNDKVCSTKKIQNP